MFFGYEPKLGTAMRRGHWKMQTKGDVVELYDLSTDLKETTNVAAKHPERAREMRAAIEAWKRSVTSKPSSGSASVPAVDERIRAAVTSKSRPVRDRRRDRTRKPAEVLSFFGIKQGMHVADVMAGDGYYTELLSPIVGKEGKVYCQNSRIPLRVFADKPLTERLAGGRLSNVVRLDRELSDSGFPKGKLDAAILIRFYHDFKWQKVDRKAFNAMMFEALKPGAVFGVVDHHARAGDGDKVGKSLHRVEASLVRKEIEAAGFVFEAESQVLRNKNDTRDWNIFSRQGMGRDATDRFVYRFRKPAAK